LATTAGSSGRGRLIRCAGNGTAAAAFVALALVLLLSCIRPEGEAVPGPSPLGPGAPSGAGPEPTVRIGLVTGASSIAIGATGGIRITGPDGAALGEVTAGGDARAVAGPSSVAIRTAGGTGAASGDQLTLLPADSGDYVRVNGRPYRGEIVLLRDRTGITAVNRVPMEAYLDGVVSSEMGRRDSVEIEALRAQAIVSRTYALRNLGRWRTDGFDLLAGISDQVYGGVLNETALGNGAVADTRGRVLTYNGELIEAFFFSTCGGRTASGVEIFRGADRPYLHSIDDVDGGGRAWCSISPRFRWRETWTGDELRAVLRRSLPPVTRIAAEQVTTVRDVRVNGRTGSGRAAGLTVTLATTSVDVDGPQVRQVLRTPVGEPLRSNAFTLSVSSAGGRVSRLVADGGGAGHGVGFCQWGAVGRARAGQDHPEILAAYYPGTAITVYY
jgi:stage II sporulation protein D